MGEARGSIASSPSRRRQSSAASRRPALPAACAFATGIWLDHQFPWDWKNWLLLGLCVALFLLALRITSRFDARLRRVSSSSVWVLLLVLLAGGARHHETAALRQANDISTFAQSEPVTLRLTGSIQSPVEILDPPVGPQIPSWMEIDRSVCVLRCQSLQQQEQPVAISGDVRLEVTGHLTQAHVGDVVELIGRFSLPLPPANPGGMDYREYLRQQGLVGSVRCEHPAAVRKIGQSSGPWATLQRWRESVRRECQKLLFRELPPQERALATSLLIGDRTGMSDELRLQFSESGTMHLLAISGVHVSILYGLIWMLCRLLNLSFRSTMWVMLLTVALYAFVADHRPPVVRAAVLATLSLLGTARGKQADGMQLLAVSALILMLWQPLDLFDAGAQLSFLAVGALIFLDHVRARFSARERQGPDLSPERSPLSQWLARQGRGVVWATTVTAYVWLVTLPVTISVFHLAAPVGLLANLVLIPYSTLVLALGFSFLLIGLLVPAAAWIVAMPFSWSLSLFASSVAWAGNLEAGHAYLPSLPAWWQPVFYLLLALSWGWLGNRQSARWGLRAWVVWLLVGAACPLWPVADGQLRCTVLSVGHGLAVVVETPEGRTLLYDAGTLGDGRRAERAVAGYLWSRSRSRAEAIIVTHADHDHYSGVFGLLKKLDIRQLCLPQTALGPGQTGVMGLCELAASRHIPVRIIQAGDSFFDHDSPSAQPELEILHPAGNFRSRFDNANSALLRIRYAGRTLLLTGDLERDGLQQLLAGRPEHVDVLLAPHHGGAAANVPALYQWASPEFVIASTGDRLTPGLKSVVGNARLLSTAVSGAITITITSTGTLTVTEHLSPAQ